MSLPEKKAAVFRAVLKLLRQLVLVVQVWVVVDLIINLMFLLKKLI